MVSDKEFVRQRFYIVKERLEDPAAVIERQDRIQLQREYRMLGKLLDEAGEGSVLNLLETWRSYLGTELGQHKSARRSQQDAYRNWQRPPPGQQNKISKPQSLSLGAEVTDKNGYVWVVDDRFLMMMDDLIVRLQRWLDNEV